MTLSFWFTLPIINYYLSLTLIANTEYRYTAYTIPYYCMNNPCIYPALSGSRQDTVVLCLFFFIFHLADLEPHSRFCAGPSNISRFFIIIQNKNKISICICAYMLYAVCKYQYV